MPDPIRRDALLRLKVETDLARAVDTAARKRGQNTSEFVRQSLRARLAADGIHVPPISPGDGSDPQPATPALREAA